MVLNSQQAVQQPQTQQANSQFEDNALFNNKALSYCSMQAPIRAPMQALYAYSYFSATRHSSNSTTPCNPVFSALSTSKLPHGNQFCFQLNEHCMIQVKFYSNVMISDPSSPSESIVAQAQGLPPTESNVAPDSLKQV